MTEERVDLGKLVESHRNGDFLTITISREDAVAFANSDDGEDSPYGRVCRTFRAALEEER